MCFGIPMQVTAVDELAAKAEAGGRREDISLALTGPVPVGSYVLVYLGSATRILQETEARQISDAIRAVQHAAEGEDFEHLLADLIEREPELPEHLRSQPGEALL